MDQDKPARLKRRTLVAGVAWATPAVMTVSAAPAHALSGVCIPKVTETSTNWVVDNAAFPGCELTCHRDVVLKFTLAGGCTQRVKIEVQPISGRAYWCAWGGTGIVSTTLTGSDSASLPTVGQNQGGCSHTAYPSVNDGIHVNPCGSGAHIQYRFTIGTQPPGAWQTFTAASITSCP